jgi:hypothetical protein
MLRCGGKFRLLVALRLTAPSLMQNGGFDLTIFFGGECEYGVYMVCIVQKIRCITFIVQTVCKTYIHTRILT